ncbi:MAG: PKD domain-containing protein, partial [Saprospiraceae bacterium]|nr:PKD domain-containing protein [Saprospiraceae bacterium]
MKHLFLSLCCFLALDSVFCQKHDYVWMSGGYNPSDDSSTDFTIDFNFLPPRIEKIEGKIMMGNANVSIASAEGMLQYYTNGCIIKTHNHTIMENGDYINGGIDSDVYYTNCGPQGWGSYPVIQGIFALPVDSNFHELFHIRFESNPSGPNLVCQYGALLYSRININANQGMGQVVLKDSILAEGCFQTACANRHANGRDWWILLPDNANNRFFRFLSTPEGIQGPWIQEIENPTIVDTFFYLGWAEFSQNGDYFLINDIQSGTAIYDFNRCTGLLSNLRSIPAEIDEYGYGYAAAFSPNSRFVYIIKGAFTTMEQFDLKTSDLQLSRITVAEWDGFYDYVEPNGPPLQASFSFFQHGPDGKLYNWAGGARFIHTMDFPNRKGINCHVRLRSLKLPYYTSGANAYYPNYRLGPVDGSACDSLGIDNLPVAQFRHDIEDTLAPLAVTFTDLSYYAPTNWHWDFGDGSVSQDTSPVHVFPAAGTYNVCLTVSNAFAADTFCRQVQVGTVGLSDLLPVLPRARISPNPFGDLLRVSLP